MSLTETQRLTLGRIKEAIAHSDQFNGATVTDDEPLFMCPDETLLELPYTHGQLKLGDLRDLVTLLDGDN